MTHPLAVTALPNHGQLSLAAMAKYPRRDLCEIQVYPSVTLFRVFPAMQLCLEALRIVGWTLCRGWQWRTWLASIRARREVFVTALNSPAVMGRLVGDEPVRLPEDSKMHGSSMCLSV
jgi:hypothetical protein